MDNHTLHTVSHRKDLQILWIHKSIERKRKLTNYKYGTRCSKRLTDHKTSFFYIFIKTLNARKPRKYYTLRSIIFDSFNFCSVSHIFNHLSCYVKNKE